MRNKIAYNVIRILLGLAFVFYGGTKFLPAPADIGLPPAAMDFLNALAATGYMIPVVAIVELLFALALLTNWWVPLATLIHIPVMVNVVLFNIFLSPSPIFLPILAVLVLMEAYIVYYVWDAYKPLFRRKQ